MNMEFPGNPGLYKKIAVGLTLYINGTLFIVFSAIKYFLHGDTWMFGWKPILLTILFAAWFARVAYRWMMRLDAQYGRGSGWTLERTVVKLPEMKSRRREPRAG